MATLIYGSLSEVPDTLRDYAKEGEDGKFAVKVAAQDKITEFRDNNVSIAKERDELLGTVSKYEAATGVQLTELSKLSDFAKEFESLRATKARVDAGELLENSTLEEAAQARVTEVTNGYRGQLETAAKERDAWKDKASKAVIAANQMRVENAIRLAASDPDVAMLDQAVNYILPSAHGTFRVDDHGKLVPKTVDGTIIYGSDGVNPMTIKEWLLKEREASSFMFKGSKGGGASGSDQKIAGRLSAAELAAMPAAERMNYARKHGLM